MTGGGTMKPSGASFGITRRQGPGRGNTTRARHRFGARRTTARCLIAPLSVPEIGKNRQQGGGILSERGGGGPDRQVAVGGAVLQDARRRDRGRPRRSSARERRPRQAGEGRPRRRHGRG